MPLVTLDGQYAGLSIAGRCAGTAGVPTRCRAVHGDLRFRSGSPRERPIGKLQDFNVSEHLVDKMARQIRLKCGAVNRVQAVAFAIRTGMIR